MNNNKDNYYFARKIIENINAIQNYVFNKSYEEFLSDDELMDAVMFRLIQMIENIKNVSEDFKEANSNVPWKQIIGFRNGIVHEYGKTDYFIVYETATRDLNSLKAVFEALLK